MTRPSHPAVPWYRVRFVWLLIALPLTVVIASFVTLALAIRSDDGVVEDDYYKQGKEINRTLARDQAAAAKGLEAELTLDRAAQRLQLTLRAHPGTALPEAVELKFLHATRSGLDQTVVLPQHPPGQYLAPLPALAAGRWNLQLGAQDWRLTGSLAAPHDTTAALRPAN